MLPSRRCRIATLARTSCLRWLQAHWPCGLQPHPTSAMNDGRHSSVPARRVRPRLGEPGLHEDTSSRAWLHSDGTVLARLHLSGGRLRATLGDGYGIDLEQVTAIHCGRTEALPDPGMPWLQLAIKQEPPALGALPSQRLAVVHHYRLQDFPVQMIAQVELVQSHQHSGP